MTDDSHAARNAAQLREVERQQSHGLVRSHNALIAMLAEREDVADRLLDDDQLEAMDDALDQLEAVAASIRDDDRLLDKHERLLASRPEREQLVTDGGGYRCGLCGTAHHSRYDAMACCSDRFDDPPLLTDGGRDVDLNGECPACGNKTLWRGECAHPDCEGPAPRRVAFDGGRDPVTFEQLVDVAEAVEPGDEVELATNSWDYANPLEVQNAIVVEWLGGGWRTARIDLESSRGTEHRIGGVEGAARVRDRTSASTYVVHQLDPVEDLDEPLPPEETDGIPPRWEEANLAEIPQGVTPEKLEEAVDGSRTLLQVCGQLGISPEHKGKIRVLTTVDGLYEQLESPEAGPSWRKTA